MGVRETARTLFGRHSLFQGVAEADLDRLAGVAHTRSYGTDQVVFLKGDPGSTLMAVERGRVRICSHAPDGQELVLNVMLPGDVFGEIALLDGGPRTAAAYADEPTTLIVIDRRDFFAYLERTPSASARLIEILCHRLRWVSDQVEDLTFLDLRSRLAKRLLQLADTATEAERSNGPPLLRVTQEGLARRVCNTRQAVNRQLRALQDEGLIRTRRGCVVVLDRDGLERIAEGEA